MEEPGGLRSPAMRRPGYASQQTEEPVDPDRRDNLWEPVAGDHGAHGRFDARAHASSLQLWLTMRRRAVGIMAGAVTGIIAFEVEGVSPADVVARLLEKRIVASTSPYKVTYARLAPSLVNDEQEVDAVVRALRTIAGT